MNVNISISEGVSSYKEEPKRIAVGDVVNVKGGGSFTVKGFLLGVIYPTIEQVRAIIAPLYPAGSDVKVVKLKDVVGYEDLHNDPSYGDDSIFWGT